MTLTPVPDKLFATPRERVIHAFKIAEQFAKAELARRRDALEETSRYVEIEAHLATLVDGANAFAELFDALAFAEAMADDLADMQRVRP